MISIAQSFICISFIPMNASTPVFMMIDEHLQTMNTLCSTTGCDLSPWMYRPAYRQETIALSRKMKTFR